MNKVFMTNEEPWSSNSLIEKHSINLERKQVQFTHNKAFVLFILMIGWFSWMTLLILFHTAHITPFHRMHVPLSFSFCLHTFLDIQPKSSCDEYSPYGWLRHSSSVYVSVGSGWVQQPVTNHSIKFSTQMPNLHYYDFLWTTSILSGHPHLWHTTTT